MDADTIERFKERSKQKEAGIFENHARVPRPAASCCASDSPIHEEFAAQITMPSSADVSEADSIESTCSAPPSETVTLERVIFKGSSGDRLGLILESSDDLKVTVHAVREGSVAEGAGLLAGDELVEINGKSAPPSSSAATAILKASGAGCITLTVRRLPALAGMLQGRPGLREQEAGTPLTSSRRGAFKAYGRHGRQVHPVAVHPGLAGGATQIPIRQCL